MQPITYVQHCEYLFPLIALREPPPEITPPLGKYGRNRQAFLNEHRPILYTSLLLSEKLYTHLREIDEEEALRLAVIADRDQAEEIINELVYE